MFEFQISPVFIVIWLAVVLVVIIGMWKMFEKAGKPGWAAIVPIYNLIVLFEIAGRPLWWFLLALIPLVNIAIGFILSMDIAKSFGKDTGFAILIFLLPYIAYPILGFGDAEYIGPSAAEV